MRGDAWRWHIEHHRPVYRQGIQVLEPASPAAAGVLLEPFGFSRAAAPAPPAWVRDAAELVAAASRDGSGWRLTRFWLTGDQVAELEAWSGQRELLFDFPVFEAP